MSKRLHANSNGGIELLDATSSRHKRRREGHKSTTDADIMKASPSESRRGAGVVLSKAEVKEMGNKMWQAVKDTVKDGRQLSVPFLVKPSKAEYPDYYFYIKNPIALDDIKKHLNKAKYSSLEDVKKDFELLVANAKQYNRPDSIIYEDAEYLLQLVYKTYNNFVPEDHDDGSPDLYELLQERLDKVVSKSDPIADRLLATEFMQLPSKKQWPFYYTEIKNPRCFDDVYRSLNEKDYDSSADFAADVDLIFSNAMAFNQDGTQIYNDAVTLRDYFRRLMSDLPPPYSLPEYSKPTNKIRIRPVLAAQAVTPSSSRSAATKQESTPLTLKVPAAQPQPALVKASTPAPAVNTFTLPVAPVTAQRPPPGRGPAALKPSTPQIQNTATPQPAATTQPVSFVNATPLHYPRTQTPQVPAVAPVPTLVPPVVAPAPPVLRASSVLNTTLTRPQTPAVPPVVYPLSRQLKSVNIQIQPNHRRLRLDHRDGVKTWSVRLVPGESTLLVNDVTYMEEEEDESSGDEHLDDEDDVNMDVDHEVSPSKETRKKGKGKGRGRPVRSTLISKAQAASTTKAAKAVKKKVSRKPEDIQLKLNSFIVSEQAEKPGEWNVCLVTGSNVIEIGEAGGMIWKLYTERIVEV